MIIIIFLNRRYCTYAIVSSFFSTLYEINKWDQTCLFNFNGISLKKETSDDITTIKHDENKDFGRTALSPNGVMPVLVGYAAADNVAS